MCQRWEACPKRMTNFCCRFITNYATLTEPLRELNKEMHTFCMDQEARESIGKTTSCPYQRAMKWILRFYQDNGSLYWCKSCWCCRRPHSKGTWWWRKKGNCLCQPSYVIARADLLTTVERSPCHSLGLCALLFIFLRRKIRRIYRSPTAG